MSDLKLTSYSEGFGIFNKVSEEEFDVVNKNYLRMFMLNTENKLFNYDEMYDYILPNITKYVFSRKRLAEIENNPSKQGTIILDALNHLRPIENEADKGAGGELGEILLYLFLEQDNELYDIISDEEKKELISTLVKEIQIYPEGESEMPLKSMKFNFPVYKDGKEVREIFLNSDTNVETLVVLSKKIPDIQINGI